MTLEEAVGPTDFAAMLLMNVAASALLSAVLIVLLMPVLRRYALARPNARSSHKAPTPQGGGIAVVAAALIPVAGLLLWLAGPQAEYVWDGARSFRTFWAVAAAAIALAFLGAIDDIRPLPVMPRLLLQILGVAVVVTLSPSILPVPSWIEVPLLVLAGLWFVNLVNFMDGLDWITVAEMVPITGFIALLGWSGDVPATVAIVAAALCGALLGFAPFNKPVAKLFLGDVGSLSIGLLVGWLLLNLAAHGGLAAAILLPLYYLMDATVTLLKRLARGERVWEAHRSHFYQQATVNGFSALAVSAHVFALNLVLAALAAVTLIWPSPSVSLAALLVGIVLVGLLLRHFAQARLETAR